MSSSADQSAEYSDRIAKFVTVTGSSVGTAQRFLEGNNFELEDALQDYFEESARPTEASPAASSSGPEPKKSSQRKKNTIRSFQELINGTNDDETDDEDVNLFTGGEKSALQVENPNKNRDPTSLVQDILKKATDPGSGARRDESGDSAGPAPKKFSGTGHKLGDSQTPSTAVPDRSAAFKKPERVERKITFWKDGFSVGEGKLFRYDDPRNGAYLRDLNSGRAPLELLDVKLGQDVDVNVDKRLDENYTPPKRKIGGFEGSGQRLGSPVPGDASASPVPVEVPVAAAPAAAAAAAAAPKEDAGEGDTKLQIRFASGKRVVRKFHSSDPVQAIYDFVSAETDTSRAYYLSLSFPVKPLEDRNISIKDAGLANAAVIQRWS